MPEHEPSSLALERSEQVADALVRARGENLVDLYDGWRSMLIARACAAAARAREADALKVRGEMILRSVENARALAVQGAPAGAEAGLVEGDELARFIAETQRDLDAAREALARGAQEEERFFATQIAEVKQRIQARAGSLLAHHRPRVDAHVQPVGGDQAIVHLARPEPQDLVLIGYLLSGKLFTRYDAFFDDSVDELGLEPARFYAEEGNARVRFDQIEDEEALLDDPQRVFVPVKGIIAFRVPGRDFPRFRFVNRGPVMEAEARERGGAYANLMARASAELLAGLLVKLKVENRIELVLRIA